MIVHDPRNPVAIRHAELLRAHLGGDELERLSVVIGGDGFMLHSVAKLGLKRPFVGLNAGRVGFLLNDVADWAEAARALLQHDLITWEFPLIRAQVHSPQGQISAHDAVNDVYLERASGQTARLSLSVDGTEVVNTLVADGVIDSTALGSTAYNFSAGGPPCHPSLKVLSITPICPHLPRLSAFALPHTAQIQVDVQHPERRPVRAVVDGRDAGPVSSVSIGYGPKNLRLAYFTDHDFTARMMHKILHP